MIVLSLLVTAVAPFLIVDAAIGGDVVNGAIVAGIFSIVNTVLNARMLRRLAEVNQKVGATKAAAHDGVRALTELAEETRKANGG